MESSQRWTKKAISERKVDKELQRIKSLGVVSVLNKAFGDTEPTTSRSRSSSQVEIPAVLRRPGSEHFEPIREDELTKIPTDSSLLEGKYELLSRQFEQAKEQIEQAKDHMEQVNEQVEQFKEQNTHQQRLLNLQDTLVQALSQQIDFLLIENKRLSAESGAQVTMEDIKTTLDDLRREDWKEELTDIQSRLETSERKMNESQKTAVGLQKDTRSQSMSIEAKMETLMNQLKEKNEVVDKLYYEQHIKQMFPSPEDGQSSRPRSMVSRHKGILPAASPPPCAPLPPIPAEQTIKKYSRPSSAYYNNNRYSAAFNSSDNIRHSACDQDLLGRSLSIYNQETTSRPVSTVNDHESTIGSRPVSTCHEPSSSDSAVPENKLSIYNDNKEVFSASYISEESRSVPCDPPLSRPVSTYEDEISEMVYYKEFTEQLQERLSTSKEIDELSVWKPSDYDEIQKKINSKDWLEDEQRSAFWKGMKKKLRV